MPPHSYPAPQIRRVSRRHCALYKLNLLTYLLTYKKANRTFTRLCWTQRPDAMFLSSVIISHRYISDTVYICHLGTPFDGSSGRYFVYTLTSIIQEHLRTEHSSCLSATAQTHQYPQHVQQDDPTTRNKAVDTTGRMQIRR